MDNGYMYSNAALLVLGCYAEMSVERNVFKLAYNNMYLCSCDVVTWRHRVHIIYIFCIIKHCNSYVPLSLSVLENR